MNQLKKSDIHQIKLELIKVPILLGYPAQNYFEAERIFPNHGLWSSFGGCLVAINVNEQDLREYKERIITQTQEMYNYCSNYEENRPLAKEEFPMVEDKKICKYCNYKELCCRD